MKKLFLGLAVAASSLSFAQQFGAKAGTNFSTISSEGYDETKMKVGFYAGVFYNMPLTDNIRLQPEVLYNNLGSETKNRVLGTDYSRKLNLNFITVPVMFQMKPTEHFYVEAGPSFGFLVGADSKTTISNSLGTATTATELNTDDFNKFDMGLAGGVGFDITENFGVNARYTYGFSDLTKPSSDPSVNAKNRSNNIQLGINYKF